MKIENMQSFVDYGTKSVHTDWMLIPAVISAIETFVIFLFLSDVYRMYILIPNLAMNIMSIAGYIYIVKKINYTRETDFLCSGIYAFALCFGMLSVSYLCFIRAQIRFSPLFLCLVLLWICSILISALYYTMRIKNGKYNGKSVNGNKKIAGYFAATLTGIFLLCAYFIEKQSQILSEIIDGIGFLLCSVMLSALLGVRYILKYYCLRKLNKSEK